MINLLKLLDDLKLSYELYGEKSRIPEYVVSSFYGTKSSAKSEQDSINILDISAFTFEKVSIFKNSFILCGEDIQKLNDIKSTLLKKRFDIGILLITEPIKGKLLHKKIEGAIKEEARYLHHLIYKDYINLVNMLTKGADISDIESIAYKVIGNPMIITDASFKVFSYSKGIEINDPIWNNIVYNEYCPSDIVNILQRNGFWDRLNKSEYPLFAEGEEFSKHVRRAVVKVKSEEEVKGYIALLEYNKKITDTDLQILRMIAELIGAKLTEENAVSRAREQLSKEFISDLLNGVVINEKMAIDRASSINWTAKKLFAVINISCKNREEYIGDYVEGILNVIQRYAPSSKWNLSLKNLYVIANFNKKDEYKSLMEKGISNYCRLNKLHAGVGRTVEKFLDIYKSFEESKKAIEISQSLSYYKEKSRIDYSEIALYDLLNLIIESNKAEVQKYYSRNILKLLKEDEENDTQYIETVKAYFQHNQNPTNTAEALYVHRNTINYRLGRIRQIVEDDFNNPLIRLHMDITLKIMDLIG